MSERYYNPDKGTMFDSNVVDGIHRRYELRVNDAQSQVSVEFGDLKRLGRDLLKAQRFEDVVFGRFLVPCDLINDYLSKIKMQGVIGGVSVKTTSFNKVKLTVGHVKYGRVVLNLSVCDIVLNKNALKLVVYLDSMDMPETSWFVRNMIRVGLKTTGLEITALNKSIPALRLSKSPANPKEYEVDLTDGIRNTLNERNLSLEMVRLLNWSVDSDGVRLQMSINSGLLAKYLKKKMPILFD